MKVAITGAGGMLGASLLKLAPKNIQVFATGRKIVAEKANVSWSPFDLTDSRSLRRWLENSCPDWIIHCAALIDVQFCENNPNESFHVHAEIPKAINRYIDDHGGRMLYVSTDSVFDGKKKRSYIEDDAVNPLNVYAKSKVQGEEIALKISRNVVLRTNILGLAASNRVSFSQWLVESLRNQAPIQLYDDVIFSPLHVDQCANLIWCIIHEKFHGLYHCGSSGSVTKYEFGIRLSEEMGLSTACITRGRISELQSIVARPLNMSLNSQKLATDLNREMPSIFSVVNTLSEDFKGDWF